MQQRYYDPAVGRFLSPDPVAPTPGNIFNFGRYTYANDNPIVNIDPTGMYKCDPDSKDRAACDHVKAAVGNLHQAIRNPNLGPRAHAKFVEIAKKIGKAGQANGVIIYTSGHTIGGEEVLGGAQIKDGKGVVGIQVAKIRSAGPDMSDKRFEKYLAGDVAHEFSHLLDELAHPSGYPTGLFAKYGMVLRCAHIPQKRGHTYVGLLASVLAKNQLHRWSLL